MRVRVPDPRKNHWTIERVASRWKIPVAFARLELEAAGIEFVKIPRPPRLGVRLKDLLQFEQEAGVGTGQPRTQKSKKSPFEVVS